MAQPNREERGKLYRGNWDALNFDRRAPEFFWEIFCAQCDKAITRDYIIEVVTQTGGLTYEEADALCKAANSNSQLASIHSPVEDQFIIDISAMATTTSQYQTLLGGKRVENGWQWSDGTAFDYTNFAADGNTGRQCVQSPKNPATKPAECSLGWYYDRRFNSCYKVVTPNSSILDFNSANEVCQNASAQLASIHSAEENELIVALASDLSLTVSVISYQTLLGARRVDNTWTWTDGTPFDYNNILADADYNYIPCLQLWATNTTVICFTHYSALNTLL
ncbi:unnamed protein product, partial [Mesorhabditis belari]|uniref:C-type lectin domain-containing protein n=1 Tax=Mesorhabditis belari TaxID=2138241 RepID=A0AAF3F8Z9_9BILA